MADDTTERFINPYTDSTQTRLLLCMFPSPMFFLRF